MKVNVFSAVRVASVGNVVNVAFAVSAVGIFLVVQVLILLVGEIAAKINHFFVVILLKDGAKKKKIEKNK